MFKAFEIECSQGRSLREYPSTIDELSKVEELKQEVEYEEWYQIRAHNCYHDEGGPCEPWRVVASKGEKPQDEEG